MSSSRREPAIAAARRGRLAPRLARGVVRGLLAFAPVLPAGCAGDSAPAAQDPGGTARTPADTAAATLEGVMALQERILARLDSLEAAGAGAGSPGDDAAGIDLDEARDEVTGLGYGIFWSIVVLVFFHFAIRAVIWVLEALSERSVARRLTFKWLIPITRMLLWAIAGYLIVRTIFRIDAQGILAASAALGLALGIAAQDLLKNVFGGLIVVFDQPFQVGDKISVGDTYGEVVSIGLRSTRIATADDDLVSVPNAQVVEEQVANANAGQLNCQVVTNLHLPGGVDERKARDIAFEAAVTSKYVFLEKPVQVFVEDEFRTTFVTRVRVRAYVLDPRFEFLLRSDITERAREGFRAAGLAPERDWYPPPFAAEDSPPGDRAAP
ncbi:MAG: mechanosensitive ion channel [Gemmatimonadota bacterium]|nr:mechanosensitive ion channel [Gemmatimonadota bacterium]